MADIAGAVAQAAASQAAVVAASQDAVASLEAQQKELKQRQTAIKKELKKKKQVEKRLMSKAANNLSQESAGHRDQSCCQSESEGCSTAVGIASCAHAPFRGGA